MDFYLTISASTFPSFQMNWMWIALESRDPSAEQKLIVPVSSTDSSPCVVDFTEHFVLYKLFSHIKHV